MDKVLVMNEYDEFIFEQTLANSKEAVSEYYNSLDHSLYSDEAEITLGQLVAEALEALDSAVTVEEMASIVAEFKANVDKVAKKTAPVESTAPQSKGGCKSSIGGAVACLMPTLAAAVVMISRKKRED